MCDFVVFVTELYRRVVKMATAEFLCLKLYRVCEILETLLDKDVVEQIVITKLDRMRELIDELKDPDAKAAKEAYEKKWAEFWDKVVDVLAKKQRPAPVASTVVLPTKSDSEELPDKAVPEAVEATISGLLEKAKETMLEKCGSEDAVAEIVDTQVSPLTVVKENESCGLGELNDFLENRDRGPSKESSDKWIKESIIRFGVPKEWTADRGLQFESKEFKEFVNGLGIKHNFGAAYHHQTNGMIERWNRSGEQLLRSCPGEEEWEAKRPKVLATYGTSPFEVMFVQQPSLELDAKFGFRTSERRQVLKRPWTRRAKSKKG